jgi:hypothetical protein
VSADQAYREADLAIDFREDVAELPASAVQRIKRIFEEEGAIAKISSIHVNGWFGRYDKLSMTRRFATERLRVDLDATKDAFVFVGDSPNDAPMFGFFPNSCGVANVSDFSGRIEAEPAFVAGKRGGAGFVEIVDMILAHRIAAGARQAPSPAGPVPEIPSLPRFPACQVMRRAFLFGALVISFDTRYNFEIIKTNFAIDNCDGIRNSGERYQPVCLSVFTSVHANGPEVL